MGTNVVHIIIIVYKYIIISAHRYAGTAVSVVEMFGYFDGVTGVGRRDREGHYTTSSRFHLYIYIYITL